MNLTARSEGSVLISHVRTDVRSYFLLLLFWRGNRGWCGVWEPPSNTNWSFFSSSFLRVRWQPCKWQGYVSSTGLRISHPYCLLKSMNFIHLQYKKVAMDHGLIGLKYSINVVIWYKFFMFILCNFTSSRWISKLRHVLSCACTTLILPH